MGATSGERLKPGLDIMADVKIDSLLAADCGSVTTTVILVDQVDGKHRLLATARHPSTYGPPWYDITIGVQEAIRQIEKRTDRLLLTPGGRPITPRTANQQGVDAFVAVSSAGPPLKVVLVGLMEQLSLASARRAAAGTYTRVTGVLSLNSEPNTFDLDVPGGLQAEARLQTIREGQPDVILLVGGTDGGAERPVLDLARLVAMTLQLFNNATKPAVLYAGNVEARFQVAEILGPITELKSIDNVRPELDIDHVVAAREELENMYLQRKMFSLPGVQKLSNWSQTALVPGSKSFEKLIVYLSRHNNLKVVGVNLGSGATTICTKTEEWPAAVTNSNAGIGHGLPALLKAVPLEKIHRWLPFEMAVGDLHNQLRHKTLHPASMPATPEELLIEYALAREALRLVTGQARSGWPLQPATGIRDVQWNLIVGAGLTLMGTPRPGHAVMLVLDGLEPWGVTSLALDMNGAANLLGSMAIVQPAAAVEVAAQGAFVNIATLVAPAGHGQPGKPAIRLKATYEDGTTAEVEVMYGAIEVMPLAPGTKANLEMRPTRNFDIGLGQPGQGATAEVEGGQLGIIIDARGRPLRLPPQNEQRQQQLHEWLATLSGIDATTEKNN